MEAKGTRFLRKRIRGTPVTRQLVSILREMHPFDSFQLLGSNRGIHLSIGELVLQFRPCKRALDIILVAAGTALTGRKAKPVGTLVQFGLQSKPSSKRVLYSEPFCAGRKSQSRHQALHTTFVSPVSFLASL